MTKVHEGLSWIVCWTDGDHGDDYAVADSYEAAKERYDNLITDGDLDTLSLCAVIESSDFDTHPAFKDSPTP